jgi:hypothetical protein
LDLRQVGWKVDRAVHGVVPAEAGGVGCSVTSRSSICVSVCSFAEG